MRRLRRRVGTFYFATQISTNRPTAPPFVRWEISRFSSKPFGRASHGDTLHGHASHSCACHGHVSHGHVPYKRHLMGAYLIGVYLTACTSWACISWVSRNSPVAVTLTHGPRYLLFLRPETLILVLFFI